MTAPTLQPPPPPSRLPNTPLIALLATALLGWGTHKAAPAAALGTPLMQGHLDVHEQRGSTCASPAQLPLHLPVWAVWQEGQWWLWGDMAPMRLRPPAQAAAETADLLPWASDTPQGTAQWTEGAAQPPAPASTEHPSPAAFTVRWQEAETPKGCAFTAATLRLAPWAASTGAEPAPAAASLLAHQRLLRDTLAALAALQSASNAREAAQPLQRLLGLVREASAPALAFPWVRQDRSLALAWLQAGEHASALRQHPQALELLQAAFAVYGPLAGQHPAALQDAALALSSLARAQLRARQPEQAQATITQAIALLGRHQGTHTAAAASLHNQQGALWLRNQRAKDALDSFARALAADESRNAPAIDRVATLMNSAVALEELGQQQAAQAVYERCQQLLANEPANAESEQLAQWVQARLQALQGPGAGRTL